MAHKITRLKAKLLNTPHLIDEQSFNAILSYINDRNATGILAERDDDDEDKYERSRFLYNDESRTAILYIEGPLTAKPTGMEMFCGGTSYEGLKEDFADAVELGAKTVVFMTDSGGGEASTMMDTANYLRKMADDNDVKIISYVDGGMAASAAYGIICVSDEIVAQADSDIGSIGVLVRLMNDSKHLEKEGYERTFVTAGSEKVPFSEDGSFRKEFLEDIQYKVDKLYESFTSHVATHRGMSVEAVKATEARTYLADDAMRIGLVDKVMSLDDFYEYLAEYASAQRQLIGEKQTMFKFKKEAQAAAEAKAQVVEATTRVAEMADVQAAIESAVAELQASHVAEMGAIKEQLEAMQAVIQEKESLLAKAQDTIAQMEQQHAVSAKEMKLKERTNALAECMDADAAKVNALALEALDDDAFAVVLSGYQAQRKALEGSDLFKRVSEVGEENQPTAHQAVVDTATEATLALMRARGMLKDE